jgi:hypothetical protein
MLNRLLSLLLPICFFAAGALACKTPGPPDQSQSEGQPTEPAPQTEAPPSADEPPADEGTALIDDAPPHQNDPACPPPQEPDGMCIQMIAYAKNPDTSICCEYPTPCHAPDGWETFPTMEACEEG